LLEQVGRQYLATQGTELGRDGRVRVRVLDESGRGKIAGQAITVIDGELRIG
jgi:predicted PhzF superfamily epimerase YddE/YHI9